MPNTDKKFQIKVSEGMANILKGIVFMFAFMEVVCLRDMIVHGPSVMLFLMMLMFGWCLAMASLAAFAQKIEIAGGVLMASTMFPETKLFYLPKRGEIALADIAQVTVASREYFETHAHEFRSDSLMYATDVYRRARSRRGRSLEKDTRLTPIMFVAAKPGRDGSFAAAVNIFSGKDFARMVTELERRGVKVVTEAALRSGAS